jgi:hypothetical protein
MSGLPHSFHVPGHRLAKSQIEMDLAGAEPWGRFPTCHSEAYGRLENLPHEPGHHFLVMKCLIVSRVKYILHAVDK